MLIRSLLVSVFILMANMNGALGEKLPYISLSAVKLYGLCNKEKSDKELYFMCPVYIRGWVQGAWDQHFKTVVQCVLSNNNCKKATVLGCIDYANTSAIELGRQYVSFYREKLESLSLSEAVEYNNKSSGTVLAEMAKARYTGCK